MPGCQYRMFTVQSSELQLPATGGYLAPIFQRAQWSQLLTAKYFPLGLQ